jgi:ankyrin repeat protein
VATVRALLGRRADVRHKDMQGRTALNYAEARNYADIVQLLQEATQQQLAPPK